MIAAGAAPTSDEVNAWINHPDQRVVAELLVRFPELLDVYWLQLMGWAVARQRKGRHVWTWMLDRVWDAVARHAPEVLRRGAVSERALDLHLKYVDERTYTALLGAYVSTPVWASVARHAREIEFLRACGAMQRFDCWAYLMANPHVGHALRDDVLHASWDVLVGVDVTPVHGPIPAGVQPHVAVRVAALDILEQAPEFLSTRAPEELHGALDLYGESIQPRMVALAAQVGVPA